MAVAWQWVMTLAGFGFAFGSHYAKSPLMAATTLIMSAIYLAAGAIIAVINHHAA